MSTMLDITRNTERKVTKVISTTIITIMAMKVNMERNTIPDIMMRKVDITRSIMTMADIMKNIMKREVPIKEESSVKRKGTRKATRPKVTTTNSTRTNTTNSTNSTMTTTKPVIMTSTDITMSTTRRVMDTTRREDTISLDTMRLITARKVITTRANIMMIITAMKANMEENITTTTTRNMARRMMIKEERNTVITTRANNLFNPGATLSVLLFIPHVFSIITKF